MESREKVLEIYPNAMAFPYSFGGMKLWSVAKDITTGYVNDRIILSQGYSPSTAWDNAWIQIQKDMLRVLEK